MSQFGTTMKRVQSLELGFGDARRLILELRFETATTASDIII
jgi:hypothetical protein